MSLQIIEELAQENKRLLEEIQELKAVIANLKRTNSA